MQANQTMQATACPLHPWERQGPRRSLKVVKPPDQDFAQEGHHTQISGVAWEWDPWGLSYACDDDTGHHEEAWSFQQLQQGIEGLWRGHESCCNSRGLASPLWGDQCRDDIQVYKDGAHECQGSIKGSPCKGPKNQTRNQGGWKSAQCDWGLNEGWLPS